MEPTNESNTSEHDSKALVDIANEMKSTNPSVCGGLPPLGDLKANRADILLLDDIKARLHTQCFDRIMNYLQTKSEVLRITTNEYSAIYSLVYIACSQRSPYYYAKDMYDLAIEEAKKAAVIFSPGTQECEQWIRFISHAFQYLDRFYVPRHQLSTISDALQSAQTLKATESAAS